MRSRFHLAKSKTVLARQGISLDQAAEIFDQVYIVDQKSDALGEYFHLITAWKSTTMEQQLYAENT
jgi:uncharacterized DUF497 family protein